MEYLVRLYLLCFSVAKWKKLSDFVKLECDGQDMTSKLKENSDSKYVCLIYMFLVQCFMVILQILFGKFLNLEFKPKVHKVCPQVLKLI